MKKIWIYFFILVLFIQVSSCTFAQSPTTVPIKIAIKKYKNGNYTGCLQDCQYIIKSNPSSAVAYYYMAMAYVQAGKKDEAIKAYSKVLSLNPNAKLAEYAASGKRCLETPDKCVLETDATTLTEIDKLIAAPFTDGLSNTVRKDFEQKRLDSFKNKINSGKELDDYQLDKLNDASGQQSPAEPSKAISKKPTNDEIVAALKVLNDAGLNPYTQQSFNQQNPEVAQVNMLMSGDGQLKNSNSDAMLNMLPFVLSQNKYGTNNYSPQLMQAVIMNSMMPDFNLDLNQSKDSY